MRRALALRLMTMAACVSFAACDGGPKGPGVISATVIGPTPLGAVVLEVTGGSVRGFVGQGDTQAYGAVASTAGGMHRVVLVSRSGSSIQFGIEVEDLGADPPIASAVFAAGPDNLPKLLTGVEVLVES